MTKTKRLIVSGLISVVVLYLGFVLYSFVFLSHHFDDGNSKRYFWLFKDSVRRDIDTFFHDGYVKKRDILFYNYYKNSYHIAIWEFKDLDVVDLKNIPINQNINLDKVKFWRGERFNKNGSPSPLITLKFSYNFNYVLNVNLDSYSKVVKTIESKNYKGFFGNINKMTFSNKQGEHVILFDYRGISEPTFFLLYKANNSFYVIMVNSEKPFDERIIELFDLK